MSETEFWYISPRAFYNKVRGFNQLKQAEYEIIRLQTVELLNIQMDKKHMIKSPDKLWKFPWEKQRVGIELAKRKAKYFEEKIKRIEARHGNT